MPRRWGPAAWLLLGAAMVAHADAFRLTSGASIEGSLVSKDEEGYRVRTVAGVVVLPLDSVLRIDKLTSVKAGEYEARRAAAADTLEDQLSVANWCLERGLVFEARRHFERVLSFEPDHEAARKNLGYVRVGEYWVEARTAIGDGAKAAKPMRKLDAEKLVNAIQTQWTVQIRAIRSTLLDTNNAAWQEDGRARVLSITDPLAIVAIGRALSDGSVVARRVMVEALSKFDQDEATMNLAAAALLDGDADVRRAALVELARRDDARVVAAVRKSLRSDSDALVERGAIAAGLLGAKAAIPDLIDCLTAQRVRDVEVVQPATAFISQMPQSFNRSTSVSLGSATVTHSPQVVYTGTVVATVFRQSRMETREVTVFRTEVMDALKQITGQNFGFDAAAWRRWYEEHKP